MNAPVFVVGPSACRADVPALSEHLAAIVRDSPADVVICDVREITSPDASTIDVLARLQLMARRLGCGIHLYGAHPRLRGLLVLTGLSEVLPLLPDPPPEDAGDVAGSGGLVGVGREAEEREDALHVEERVDPGDLVT
ncbi:hypothetical protein GCM10022251_78260 [Phytohabitans flavus]|uniref:STAS domain-containing protein n=1 Tax=Phytohabitans flavus TaxID=1076124 RepID=A0A6F8XYA4_9ACTN|nr:STAS domain-containing protein [Phytohabitans flavus]BCB78779.1 hypothetical protein Pflav_051890 [Phytohabitans flavus]